MCYVKASYLAICLYIPWSANLFVEVIAGSESILDRVLVVRGMEIEKVHTVCPQPLKGGFQLGAHALWLQRLSIPGIGLGSYAYCEWVRSSQVNTALLLQCLRQTDTES